MRKIQIQVTELRNILNGKENLKAELHGIHGSLKQTLQREREANKALLAAKNSADNIVDGICNAIVKAEQNTVIPAKVGTEELAKVDQCTDRHIKKRKRCWKAIGTRWPGICVTAMAFGFPTVGLRYWLP